MMANSGVPAMTKELWAEWLDLYLRFKADDTGIAAPFSGYSPPQYLVAKSKILYIGKATKGDCDRNKFEAENARGTGAGLQQCVNFAKTVFERARTRNSSGPSFWGFANEIAASIAGGEAGLSNVTWSNVCRIGARKGNPVGDLLGEQIDLGIRTLQREIVVLSPSILVFVTNSFADEIVMKSADAPNVRDWKKSEEDTHSSVSDVWWRDRSGQIPPAIWMRHPQGCPLVKRKYALDLSKALVGIGS